MKMVLNLYNVTPNHKKMHQNAAEGLTIELEVIINVHMAPTKMLYVDIEPEMRMNTGTKVKNENTYG